MLLFFGDLQTLTPLWVWHFFFTVFETIIQPNNPGLYNYWQRPERATILPALQRVFGLWTAFRHLIYTYSILLLTQAILCLPFLLLFLPQPERLNSRRNPHWATNFPPPPRKNLSCNPSSSLSLSGSRVYPSLSLIFSPSLFLQILSPFHQVPYGHFFQTAWFVLVDKVLCFCFWFWKYFILGDCQFTAHFVCLLLSIMFNFTDWTCMCGK